MVRRDPGLMADAYLGELDRRVADCLAVVRRSDGAAAAAPAGRPGELARRRREAGFAERAKAAGVDVTLDLWDDVFHVWQADADLLPEARDAIAADRRLRRPAPRASMTVNDPRAPHRSALRLVVEAGQADATDAAHHQRPGDRGSRRIRPQPPPGPWASSAGWRPTSIPRSTCSRSSPTRTAPSAGCSWPTPTPPRCARCSTPTSPARCSRGARTWSAPASSCPGARRCRPTAGSRSHGRFQFGSGISRATWPAAALVRDADGNLERNDAGLPKTLAFLVPKEQRGDHRQLGRDGAPRHRAASTTRSPSSSWRTAAPSGSSTASRAAAEASTGSAWSVPGIGHARWAPRGRPAGPRRDRGSSPRAAPASAAARCVDDQVVQRAFSEHTLRCARSASSCTTPSLAGSSSASDAGDPG